MLSNQQPPPPRTAQNIIIDFIKFGYLDKTLALNETGYSMIERALLEKKIYKKLDGAKVCLDRVPRTPQGVKSLLISVCGKAISTGLIRPCTDGITGPDKLDCYIFQDVRKLCRVLEANGFIREARGGQW